MNIEQLQLILATVNGVSEDALRATTVYVGYLIAKDLLIAATLIGSVYLLTRLGLKVSEMSNRKSQAESCISDIRRLTGQHACDYYDRTELNNTVYAVSQLKMKADNS